LGAAGSGGAGGASSGGGWLGLSAGLLVVLFAFQGREQFQDHALEDQRIIGQLLGRRQRDVADVDRFRDGSGRAHADETLPRPKLFRKKEKSRGRILSW
jgi:hypothetical protein